MPVGVLVAVSLVAFVLLVVGYVALIRALSGVTEHEDGALGTLGGVWTGSKKLTWPLARIRLTARALEVVPTSRFWKWRFEPRQIERADVSGIVIKRTPLGFGWMVVQPGPLLYIWPGRFRELLHEWERLGWPTDPPEPAAVDG